MFIRLPIGAKLVKAYYVILPFRGANQAAGQVVTETETDDFIEARDLAVIHHWMNEARAKKRGLIARDDTRPYLVHRAVFEHPEGGSSDIELEREMLNDGMIEVAERTTLAGRKDMIVLMAERARWTVDSEGDLHRV